MICEKYQIIKIESEDPLFLFMNNIRLTVKKSKFTRTKNETNQY